jgi:hypothetical protein
MKEIFLLLIEFSLLMKNCQATTSKNICIFFEKEKNRFSHTHRMCTKKETIRYE